MALFLAQLRAVVVSRCAKQCLLYKCWQTSVTKCLINVFWIQDNVFNGSWWDLSHTQPTRLLPHRSVWPYCSELWVLEQPSFMGIWYLMLLRLVSCVKELEYVNIMSYSNWNGIKRLLTQLNHINTNVPHSVAGLTCCSSWQHSWLLHISV